MLSDNDNFEDFAIAVKTSSTKVRLKRKYHFKNAL